MESTCNRYNHIILVKINTQFPEPANKLQQAIQQMLGPWCQSVTLIKTIDSEVQRGLIG